MDINTVAGYLLGAGLLWFAFSGGNLLAIFMNEHGILLVVGGTLSAVLVSNPPAQLMLALKGLKEAFFPSPQPDPKEMIAQMTQMAEQMHRGGLSSLQSHVKGGGFLSFAVTTTLQKPDIEHIRKVLETAIRQKEQASMRAAGVFQATGTMSPLFGLLGTIIGIVGVLKDISNPHSIGPAMSIAMTTAFYGILISAAFCTPIANKIKARAQEEKRMRELVLRGMIDIVSKAIPMEVESHLRAFAQN
jgi:chemotaxis protein MotA